MSDFVYLEPGYVVGNILLEEMDLNPGQVMFTNQKFEIPTLGLYVALSYLGPARVLCQTSELIDDGLGGQIELQSVTMEHFIDISLMAYNDAKGGNQARARFGEIPMALASIYSQQQQERYQMLIGPHPGPFMDTSFLEETQIITRYTTSVRTVSVNQKQTGTDEYYSDFSKAVPPQLTVNA